MKKRLGVIGVGIGGSYGARIHQNPNAELVAICARSLEKLQKRKLLYNNEIGANPNLYVDVDEMIEKENLDGVIVATPSSTHHEIAIKAIQAGLAVLVDKPVDINIENIVKIKTALELSPVPFGVIYPLRFHSIYRGFKDLVDQKKLGRSLICDLRLKWFRDQIYYDKGGWKGTWAYDGGGSLMNQGAHPLDLLCWLFGRPVKILGDFSHLAHNIETEDWASAIVEFSSGIKCTITTTTCAKFSDGDQISFDYHAEKGSVTVVNGVVQEGKEILNENPSPFAHPVEDFIDALVQDRKPFIGLEEASYSVELINGIYRSAREGKCVYP